MDRNKPSQNRGSKGKIAQQPPDMFIALGAKPSASRDADSKRNVVPILPKSSSSSSHMSSSSSKVIPERKREASSSSIIPSSKKLKVMSSSLRPQSVQSSSSMPLERSLSASGGTALEHWETMVIDCEPAELLTSILEAIKNNNTDRAVGLVLSAIRVLRSQRFKPCKMTYYSLIFLCQMKPSLFVNEHIVAALMSSFRREVGASVGGVVGGGVGGVVGGGGGGSVSGVTASGGGVVVKNSNKTNMYSQVIYINLLIYSFGEVSNWPEVFLKFYVEDAVSERIWIDNPYCKPFVDNIVTAFNTKLPPRSLLNTTESWVPAPGRDTGSPLTINANDDDEAANEHRMIVENWNVRTYPRYTQTQEMVEKIVLEAIQEQLARRQQPETISKNFVRFLSTACGLVEIRIIAVARIETWLHNHKLMKAAQELLAHLCYNCSANTQRDLEVVVQLTKLRLKNKQMINFFNNCLKEMVLSFPDNLFPLLKYTIYNELSNARNTNNLFVVGAMFQVSPEASADAFASICFELLLSKEDYLRSLRGLLKEINRVLRNDFNLLSVVHSLLRERKDTIASIRESELKDRIFLSLADLVCMCMLLCVTPQVRDASMQSKRDVAVLQSFQAQVSNIQREAVTWLHDWPSRTFRSPDFQHVLLKVLFLEQPEQYVKVDSWPGENERILFLRLVSEVPLLQATLVRLLLIGLSKDNNVSPNDTIEIVDQLVKRAANLAPDLLPPLQMDKLEIIDFFFNLCSYNYPENICLPVGYTAPKLAISAHYWRSWLILLILAAHNPESFGRSAWEKYPTLRMFMEMCITNHFSYPPPTIVLGDDEFALKEQQTLALEKQTILVFESHLAAASTKIEINEQTSLLLPQLVELRPLEEARRPPKPILDQLQALNSSHRMGHLLCRSRHPDFLLDIMSRQGSTTCHMPWLAELVHSSEGALAHLPVQCLCEYLLSTGPTEKLVKHTQLLTHLRTVVNGSEPQMACEVLEYLLRRLTSLQASNRAPAIKGLTLVLAPEESDVLHHVNHLNDNTLWLTHYIHQFPHLQTVRQLIVQFLRQAILIETNPVHVANYIGFLSTHGLEDSVNELLELIFDLASLIVERNSITSYILPGRDRDEEMSTLKALLSIFWVYFQKAREPNGGDSFPWSESQDQVVVRWPDGDKCTLQILIVHASIILLSYGPVENFEPFDCVLDMWFPISEERQPKAYLVDTSEEALLVPDWLKLRMIRSNVPRLLDAAVDKLEASQLVLFIQSFGIPVVSISKLLQVLDTVTVTDPKLVVDSVLDKNYMIQLVDVQNRRGAIGGNVFVKALEMQIPPVQDDDSHFELEQRRSLKSALNKATGTEFNHAELVDYLNKILDVNYATPVSKEIGYICKQMTTNASVPKLVIDFICNHHIGVVVNFLLQKTNYASMLFRLVFTKRNLSRAAVQLAERILSALPSDRRHPLIEPVLKQYLKLARNESKMDVDAATAAVSTSAPLDPLQVLTTCKMITAKRSDQVLAARRMENLGERLGRMLMDPNADAEKTGLVVDWLAAVELEIANSPSKKIQMELLFSRRQLPFRPLLISIVLQRASWKTLNTIVDYLLRQERIHDHCATSVLDFLTALTQSPRLWQGRDKAIPKHHKPEDVLHFDVEKVLILVDYILEETKKKEEEQEQEESRDVVMEKRLGLIVKNVPSCSEQLVSKLVETATVSANATETDSSNAQELLVMIYMNCPSIGKHLNARQLEQFSFAQHSHSTMDVISHTILSALTATTRLKDWLRRSHPLELAARKLAATHPDLVLRQLPMLAGSLRGRSLYDWNVMRNRGHLVLFNQVLGLLELLQPMVFRESKTLCSIMDSYFTLFRFHGHAKDMEPIVSRIVGFLQNWMVNDVHTSLRYLQQHGGTLNDLELSHPVVAPLLSSVSMPTQDFQSGVSSDLFVGAPAPPTKIPLPPNWNSLVVSLQSTDPLNALQEIDHLTSKRPQLLEDIAQHLFSAITTRNEQVRTLVTALILKLLKQNPKFSAKALPAILSALNSRDADVVKGVIDKLPSLIMVMQEHAKPILTRIYQLGVSSNMNACSNISKCIAMLTLQSGC
ncbi:PREDICTED: integrator complex subunit 1 [Nicrophorus vespilloides]|uniref:Integrator complex subunit 1 n=1 Tax=Nicrophorus vespilloides TaxID=110193 RepID=A0ABM1MXR4_NICVS|nr:PREDICTED: integrator complex subunit 1 [Nicrophorus vespilloides]